MIAAIRQTGIDTGIGLSFFAGNSALYGQCLRHFPQDQSLPLLENALAHGDVSEAFLYAHALSRLAAQLGVYCVSVPAGQICTLLRSQSDASLPAARAMLPLLRTGFDRAGRIIHGMSCI